MIDLHSHILPGVDDGPSVTEESVALLRFLKLLGFRKIIVTPHIMNGVYENTAESIKTALRKFIKIMPADLDDLRLFPGSEIYFDTCMDQQFRADKLCFLGGNARVVLYELPLGMFSIDMAYDMCGFFQKNDVVVVIAHPERALKVQRDVKILDELKKRGVLFQIDLMSLIGWYGKQAQSTVRYLVDNGLVFGFGSDIHSMDSFGNKLPAAVNLMQRILGEAGLYYMTDRIQDVLSLK